MEVKLPIQAVKAIVFDAYGTLFDVHSVVGLCQQFFPAQGQALSQLWRAKQLEYTWLLSLMERYEDFWQVTERALRFACRALNLACTTDQQAQLMAAYLELDPYPEAGQALAALAAYPLVILSNGSPRMLAAAVANANLNDIFSHIISVDQIGIYKPSPRVYQLAVDTLGLPAGAIGFVSSNSFDIMGAAAFGFSSYWVNRANQPADELDLTPAVTIAALTDLAGLV